MHMKTVSPKIVIFPGNKTSDNLKPTLFFTEVLCEVSDNFPQFPLGILFILPCDTQTTYKNKTGLIYITIYHHCLVWRIRQAGEPTTKWCCPDASFHFALYRGSWRVHVLCNVGIWNCREFTEITQRIGRQQLSFLPLSNYVNDYFCDGGSLFVKLHYRYHGDIMEISWSYLGIPPRLRLSFNEAMGISDAISPSRPVDLHWWSDISLTRWQRSHSILLCPNRLLSLPLTHSPVEISPQLHPVSLFQHNQDFLF